jgi:protein-S-isoprenylcysteine O-methyltransferase Ste14
MTSTFTRKLARLRVPLGFASGALVVWLARPCWRSLIAGFALACVGELLRIWAAGHLEKSREVTRSGPYRWLRHPLYVGSSIMSVGLALACWSVPVAALIAVYMVSTIGAAVRNENAFLRATFGPDYEAWLDASRRNEPGVTVQRRFSLARARRNREHRAVLGLLIALGLLALKLWLASRGAGIG